jgi:hypothetical protein
MPWRTTFVEAHVIEMRDFLHNILHDKPLRLLANDGCGSVSFAKKACQKPCATRRSVIGWRKTLGRSEVI